MVQKLLPTDGQSMGSCLVSALSIFHEYDPHGFHRGMDITRVKASLLISSIAQMSKSAAGNKRECHVSELRYGRLLPGSRPACNLRRLANWLADLSQPAYRSPFAKIAPAAALPAAT